MYTKQPALHKEDGSNKYLKATLTDYGNGEAEKWSDVGRR